MTAAMPLGRTYMEELKDQIAEEKDPDVVVVAVLTGSPTRGLALSMWTSLEGPAAEAHAVDLIQYARIAPRNS